MAGHVYSVTMQNQTVVAEETLVIVRSAAAVATRGSILEVLRAWVGQVGTTTNQMLGVMVASKVAAFGTYTATTPTPHQAGGNVSGITGATDGSAGTAGTDASVEGAGTVTPIVYDTFSVLNGWLWVPTPEERLIVGAGLAVILKIVGTPTTLTGWSAGITFAEIN